MPSSFPAAVPEIPVADIDQAVGYYRTNLGFTVDWGGGALGIAGISKGACRMFLANAAFREHYGNAGPILIWINLDGKDAVRELYSQWVQTAARVVSPPEDKPWNLFEFTATDLDGNLLRVFYDCTSDRKPAE